MAVRDDDHGARTAVDHPLGSRAGSDLADHAAGRRADDGEARVLLASITRCSARATPIGVEARTTRVRTSMP